MMRLTSLLEDHFKKMLRTIYKRTNQQQTILKGQERTEISLLEWKPPKDITTFTICVAQNDASKSSDQREVDQAADGQRPVDEDAEELPPLKFKRRILKFDRSCLRRKEEKSSKERGETVTSQPSCSAQESERSVSSCREKSPIFERRTITIGPKIEKEGSKCTGKKRSVDPASGRKTSPEEQPLSSEHRKRHRSEDSVSVGNCSGREKDEKNADNEGNVKIHRKRRHIDDETKREGPDKKRHKKEKLDKGKQVLCALQSDHKGEENQSEERLRKQHSEAKELERNRKTPKLRSEIKVTDHERVSDCGSCSAPELAGNGKSKSFDEKRIGVKKKEKKKKKIDDRRTPKVYRGGKKASFVEDVMEVTETIETVKSKVGESNIKCMEKSEKEPKLKKKAKKVKKRDGDSQKRVKERSHEEESLTNAKKKSHCNTKATTLDSYTGTIRNQKCAEKTRNAEETNNRALKSEKTQDDTKTSTIKRENCTKKQGFEGKGTTGVLKSGEDEKKLQNVKVDKRIALLNSETKTHEENKGTCALENKSEKKTQDVKEKSGALKSEKTQDVEENKKSGATKKTLDVEEDQKGDILKSDVDGEKARNAEVNKTSALKSEEDTEKTLEVKESKSLEILKAEKEGDEEKAKEVRKKRKGCKGSQTAKCVDVQLKGKAIKEEERLENASKTAAKCDVMEDTKRRSDRTEHGNAITVPGSKRRFSVSLGTPHSKKRKYTSDGSPVRSVHRRHSWQPYTPRCAVCKTTDHCTNDPACPAYDPNPAKRICFKGPLCCMSNMYPCKLVHRQKTFTSTEHAYQWQRATDVGNVEVADKILKAVDGFTAKRLSNELDAIKRVEWKEKNAIPVMLHLVKAKFLQVQAFRQACVESKDAFLMEATFDTFWGVGLLEEAAKHCKLEYLPGENVLGWIIMKVRNEHVEGLHKQLQDIYQGKDSDGEDGSKFFRGIGYLFGEPMRVTHHAGKDIHRSGTDGARNRSPHSKNRRSYSPSTVYKSTQSHRSGFTYHTTRRSLDFSAPRETFTGPNHVSSSFDAGNIYHADIVSNTKPQSPLSAPNGNGPVVMINMINPYPPSSFLWRAKCTPHMMHGYVENTSDTSHNLSEISSPRRFDVALPRDPTTPLGSFFRHEVEIFDWQNNCINTHEILKKRCNGSESTTSGVTYHTSVSQDNTAKPGESNIVLPDMGALNVANHYTSSSKTDVRLESKCAKVRQSDDWADMVGGARKSEIHRQRLIERRQSAAIPSPSQVFVGFGRGNQSESFLGQGPGGFNRDRQDSYGQSSDRSRQDNRFEDRGRSRPAEDDRYRRGEDDRDRYRGPDRSRREGRGAEYHGTREEWSGGGDGGEWQGGGGDMPHHMNKWGAPAEPKEAGNEREVNRGDRDRDNRNHGAKWEQQREQDKWQGSNREQGWGPQREDSSSKDIDYRQQGRGEEQRWDTHSQQDQRRQYDQQDYRQQEGTYEGRGWGQRGEGKADESWDQRREKNPYGEYEYDQSRAEHYKSGDWKQSGQDAGKSGWQGGGNGDSTKDNRWVNPKAGEEWSGGWGNTQQEAEQTAAAEQPQQADEKARPSSDQYRNYYNQGYSYSTGYGEQSDQTHESYTTESKAKEKEQEYSQQAYYQQKAEHGYGSEWNRYSQQGWEGYAQDASKSDQYGQYAEYSDWAQQQQVGTTELAKPDADTLKTTNAGVTPSTHAQPQYSSWSEYKHFQASSTVTSSTAAEPETSTSATPETSNQYGQYSQTATSVDQEKNEAQAAWDSSSYGYGAPPPPTSTSSTNAQSYGSQSATPANPAAQITQASILGAAANINLPPNLDLNAIQQSLAAHGFTQPPPPPPGPVLFPAVAAYAGAGLAGVAPGLPHSAGMYPTIRR